MNFKEATDRLAQRATHEQLAKILGVSLASIRQARLSEHAAAFRAPPPDWRQAVATLARRQGAELQALADELETEAEPDGDHGSHRAGLNTSAAPGTDDALAAWMLRRKVSWLELDPRERKRLTWKALMGLKSRGITFRVEEDQRRAALEEAYRSMGEKEGDPRPE
jgi:hypothetical protein